MKTLHMRGNRAFSHAVRAARHANRNDATGLRDFLALVAGSMLPDRALITGALRQVRG